MGQSKQPENEADLPPTYSFRYDDLLGRFGGSLQLLTATFSDNIYLLNAGPIAEAIAKLCAYEHVEQNAEYKKRFNEIVGEEVTRIKVQRWILGCLIYEIQWALTIELRHGESSAIQQDFAPELVRAVEQDNSPYLFKESIERLNQELLSIVNKNHDALSNEITRRQRVAADAMARIIPFRLSALLIGIFSNAFIGAMSTPALPNLVEEVERGFLPSLKLTLLSTRGRGATKKHIKSTFIAKVEKAVSQLSIHQLTYDKLAKKLNEIDKPQKPYTKDSVRLALKREGGKGKWMEIKQNAKTNKNRF